MSKGAKGPAPQPTRASLIADLLSTLDDRKLSRSERQALRKRVAETALSDGDRLYVIDALFDDNETCGLSADDQLLSAATYASSALLHNDLDYEPVCVYLDDGTGTAAPTASSTLWVLEIDPDLDETPRRMLQDQLRYVFS